MRNFDILSETALQLPTGVFSGVESYTCFESGELEGIRLAEKNMLITHAGELVPAYTENHRRKNKYSVEFYKSGMVKAVTLDEQQEIQTPLGEFLAETVIFFETGELRRFLPLDGKISGLWTEEEERALGIPFSFEFPFATFTALINSVSLYKSGAIRSITLFPGERINLQTAQGEVVVRHGFALYENGALESLEPAQPSTFQTQIGALTAFDPDAIGITADENSLVFDKHGRVIALTTVQDSVAVQTPEGRLVTLSPREVINPLDNESLMTEGLRVLIDYDAGTVTFCSAQGKTVVPFPGSGFTVIPYTGVSLSCKPTDCASCSLACA
ncbi:MAG: hypothetical protein LBC23_00435 [Coriobacteriales bacterium]|jgi:hypothetical protein|nr:hypothetical protein [Coriobacteriales bacterium]